MRDFQSISTFSKKRNQNGKRLISRRKHSPLFQEKRDFLTGAAENLKEKHFEDQGTTISKGLVEDFTRGARGFLSPTTSRGKSPLKGTSKWD